MCAASRTRSSTSCGMGSLRKPLRMSRRSRMTLEDGLALGVVVGGRGRAGGLSYVFHCGPALLFLVGGPGVQVLRVLYEFGVAVARSGHRDDRLRRLLVRRGEDEGVRWGRGEVRGGRHGALDGDELADLLGGLVLRGARGGRLGVRGEWRQGVRAGAGLGSRVGCHGVDGARGRGLGGGRGRLGHERVFGVRPVRRGSRVGRLGCGRGEECGRRFGGGLVGGGRLCGGVRGGRRYVVRGLCRVRALVLGRGRVHGLATARARRWRRRCRRRCLRPVPRRRPWAARVQPYRPLGSLYVGSLKGLLGCAGLRVGDNGLTSSRAVASAG